MCVFVCMCLCVCLCVWAVSVVVAVVDGKKSFGSHPARLCFDSSTALLRGPQSDSTPVNPFSIGLCSGSFVKIPTNRLAIDCSGARFELA